MTSELIHNIKEVLNTDNNISGLNWNGQIVKVLIDRIDALEKENDILWKRHNDY
jgi:hypothetical protein